MAKKGKCDRCRVFWRIKIMDQTPLKELHCPLCKGPVTPIYSPCDTEAYTLAPNEPELGKPEGGDKQH